MKNHSIVVNVSKERYVFAQLPEKGQNFWDANRELEVLTPYQQFKEKKGKRHSGRMMEAIYMIYDPKSSANQTLRDEEDIISDVSENFLKDKKFDWEPYKDIIDAYKQDCITLLERELKYWEIELKERSQYIRELDWDTQAKEKDERLAKSKQFFNEYLDILKQVQKERQEAFVGYGRTSKSLLEGKKS